MTCTSIITRLFNVLPQSFSYLPSPLFLALSHNRYHVPPSVYAVRVAFKLDPLKWKLRALSLSLSTRLPRSRLVLNLEASFSFHDNQAIHKTVPLRFPPRSHGT